MPSQQNTYRKLDRDTSKNKVDRESYYDCRNMRLLSDDPSESGAMVNMQGNEFIQSAFPGYATDVCIGSRQIRDKVLLISTNSSVSAPVITYGRLWTIDLRAASPVPTLIYNGLLNLSRANPINNNIITRYESPTVQKAYWADGYNYLRYCNLADPDLASASVESFDIINEVDFVVPEFQQLVGGKIPVGRVQYAYRLYKKYGSQTIFSPASDMINLTTANENASNTKTYKGADRLDSSGNAQSSGKSVKMKIIGVDTSYDRIEIVAIHYSALYETPNIYIVTETDVASNIYFTDTGTYESGYYSLAEYTALNNLFVPKTIATKNNILFAGNLKEEEFDVDYDARAFRFQQTLGGNTITSIYDSSGGYYALNWNNTSNQFTAISAFGGAPSIGIAPQPLSVLGNIGETWDCKQRVNDITIDPSGEYEVYQSDGVTFGGEGVNVKYEWKTKDHIIDDSGSNETFHASGSSVPYYFPSFASPFNSGSRLGYQRDEIYRFGVILHSTKGGISPVKYIGDLRAPGHYHNLTGGYNRHAVTLSGDTYGTRLYLEFTLDNLPSDVAGYQIVRVERKPEDRTVMFQGRMSFMGVMAAGIRSVNVPESSTVGDYDALYSLSTTHNGVKNVWVSAPEISFYKDFRSASGDYLQVIGTFGNANVTNYGSANWHKVHKFDTFTPLNYNTKHRRDVQEGVTVEANESPDEDMPPKVFAGMTYNNFLLIPPGGILKAGNAGTAALINLATGFDLGAVTSSNHMLVNYRRPVVQYGGTTYEARLNNKYIAASDYIPVTASSMTNNCYGGDCYVQFFDNLSGFWNQHYAGAAGDPLGRVDMFPVETTINLDLRHDDCWHRIHRSSDAKYYIKEVGNATYTVTLSGVNVDFAPGWTDYYLYNTVFSRLANSRPFASVADDYLFENYRDSKVIASTAKYNGEEVDSWTQFSLNESIDLDSGHGPINYLVEWRNSLFFYQNDGFGSLAVLERSLIQDSEGRNLTLGEGDVLQRYDMLSTEIGCSTKLSLVPTESGIYWFDAKKRRMYQLSGSLKELSMIKGMNSYFQEIGDDIIDGDNVLVSPYTGFAMTHNQKYNEIWFTIKEGATTGESLIFNTLLDDFTGFIDNSNVLNYIRQDDVLVSQKRYGALYKENSDEVERCKFHGAIHDAVLELIMNPGGNLIHTLTNLEITTELIDDAGENKLNETLSSIRVMNDYQDTGIITLVPDDNIVRRLRTWRFSELWDSGTDARIRDTYSRIRMTYTNGSGVNRKIILHDLVSIFAMPIETVVNKK